MKSIKSLLSGTARIDALLGGTQWQVLGDEVTVLTVSFPYGNGSAPSWETRYSRSKEPELAFGFDAAQQAAAQLALQQWANVAKLDFAVVSEAESSSGEIRFAFTGIDAMDGWWGWSYLPARKASGGDIWVNADQDADDWSTDSEDFMLLVHEIGHALGLKHPFSGKTRLDDDEDSLLYTLMSYDAPANNQYREVQGDTVSYRTIYPSGPMLYDIAAIQYLYGANKEFNAGDDVYLMDAKTPFFRTIWDGGGADSLSAESFNLGCRLDLREGSFSDLRMDSAPLPKGMTGSITPTYDGRNNLAIAFGTLLENAYGGRGDDHITGNDVANLLVGNAGNDTLIGAAGDDTLIGGGGDDRYVIDSCADQVLELLASGGQDSVTYKPTVANTIYELGDNLEDVEIESTLAADVVGNALDNTIYAGAGSNRMDGGAGTDTLSYAYAGRGVKITLSAGATTTQKTGGSGRDYVTGFENLTGSAYGDTLTGDAGSNVIRGQGGNDKLSGGAGGDIFVFDTPLNARRNVDSLLDFDPTEDRIALDSSLFEALKSCRLDDAGELSAAALLNGRDAISADGLAFLTFDPVGGRLYYDADGDGSNPPIAFARLFLASVASVDAGVFLFMD